MIFYLIFGDFVGWDWGTPAILQQKHPWKNWIKIWDWQTPPPQLGKKSKNFQKSNLKAPLTGTFNANLSICCLELQIIGSFRLFVASFQSGSVL